MRNWNVLAALLAVALVVPTSFAQSTDSVSKDLQALKSRVAALEVENSALKGANDGTALEGQVNALAERFSVGSAAPKVTFSGEFRSRYENFDDGFADGLGGSNDRIWGIENRALVGFGYDVGNGISFQLDVEAFSVVEAFKDSGSSFSFPGWTLGQNGGSDALAIGVYQAYSNWMNFLGLNGLSARIGRQEIKFGNQFAFGVDDWDFGTATDAINFGYSTESFAIALIYILNNGFGSDHNQSYLLHAALKSLKDMTVEAYYQSADNNLSPLDNDRYGAHFAGCFGGLGFDANLDVQENSVSGDDTFAWEANVNYDINKELGLFARAYQAETGYIFTGNRHSNTGYRARYGLADVLPTSSGSSDVSILQVGAAMACGSGWTAGATIALFDQDADDSGASEVDLWAEHACADNATLGGGIAFLSPDVGDSATFVYIQARIAF